jgi:hypothetical protein
MPPAKKAAGKKSATPAKSAVQATITLKHLAAALADSHDIAKKQAEAVLGDLVTLTTRSEEGRQNPPDRSRHPPGAQAGGQDGSQPGDRRDHQDQSQQEDRIPACQGTEGSGVVGLLGVSRREPQCPSPVQYSRQKGGGGQFA